MLRFSGAREIKRMEICRSFAGQSVARIEAVEYSF
jgi:hypothetical protein